MNIFTTDHPLMSEPREHPVLRRIFTRKTLISALIFSVIAEGLFGTGCFYLPDRSSLLYLCGIYHIPGIIVASIFVPDGFDDYVTENQEFVGECIVVAIGWLQWFVIFIACRFFTGPQIISPPNKASWFFQCKKSWM